VKQQEFRSYFETRRREEARRARARQFRAALLGVLVLFAIGWFSKDTPFPIPYIAGVLATFVVGYLFGLTIEAKEDE
jgi:fatty acid desaturase